MSDQILCRPYLGQGESAGSHHKNTRLREESGWTETILTSITVTTCFRERQRKDIYIVLSVKRSEKRNLAERPQDIPCFYKSKQFQWHPTKIICLKMSAKLCSETVSGTCKLVVLQV